jgi:hypothetical protein
LTLLGESAEAIGYLKLAEQRGLGSRELTRLHRVEV